MRSIKLAVLLSFALLFVGATLRSHVSNADRSKPSELVRPVIGPNPWLVRRPTPNPWLVADGAHPTPNPWLVADGAIQIHGSLDGATSRSMARADGAHQPNPWLVADGAIQRRIHGSLRTVPTQRPIHGSLRTAPIQRRIHGSLRTVRIQRRIHGSWPTVLIQCQIRGMAQSPKNHHG